MFGRRINVGIIALFFILFCASIYFATQIRFTYDFDNFFPRNSSDTDYYNDFKARFEPDDNFILVAVGNNGRSVFDSLFLSKVAHLTEAVSALPYITQSLSLTNLQKPMMAAGTMMKMPYLRYRNPARYDKDSARIMSDTRLVRHFIADDAASMAVVMKTGDVLDLDNSHLLRQQLDSLLAAIDLPKNHIAGRAYYQSIFVKRSQQEFLFFTAISSVIILALFILLFRRFAPILISLVSVLAGLTLFIGFLGLIRFPLDPVSTLFPILMIIVAVSDIIHILTKYIDEIKKGKDRQQAIRLTIKEIGLATLLTSLTTAVGFCSLLTSNVLPVRNFGLMAAIGVLIAYLTIIMLATSLLGIIDPKRIIRTSTGKTFWTKLMQWGYLFTLKKQGGILIVCSIVLLVSLIGILHVSTDTHLGNNFPRGDKVKTDWQFLEQHYGGMRMMEIGVDARNGHTLADHNLIKAVDSLEQMMAGLPAVATSVSTATIFRSLNRGMQGDRDQHYVIPPEAAFDDLVNLIEYLPDESLNALLSKDRLHGRISVRMSDIGADSAKVLIGQIDKWIANNIDTSLASFRHTSGAFLFDKNSESLRSSLFSGLALAFVIISLMMALLFRNIKMVLIALIPNIFPLIFAGGLIGFLGIELDAATSIIFAIAFGIAVDDTIHFLSKFKLETAKGYDARHAIRSTFLESGKAICLTTLILFLGFISLIASAYPPTYVIGLLVSITLVSALLSDLSITPVMIYKLHLVKRKKDKDTGK